MKSVSIYDLKQRLAAHLREANQGERILVTKHGKAVACLVPPESSITSLHLGSHVGEGVLKPLFRNKLVPLRALLEEDREERDHGHGHGQGQGMPRGLGRQTRVGDLSKKTRRSGK